MNSRFCSMLFFLVSGFVLQAQDYSWWNQKHNWDGQTHWSDYMILSSAYLGPNALPVPEISKGVLPKPRSVELAVDGHYSRGDQTGNLFTEIFFPFFSDRAGMSISCVPLEFYKTDTITRDIRFSREYDGKGVSFGDVCFTTFVQLVKESKRIPDVMVNISLRTASGTNLDGARHTDTPGYSFDVSVGKTLYEGEGRLDYMRGYVMTGFYVYQTNLENHRQNDAFSYGAGFDLNFDRLRLENQLGGYIGYLDNGDKPMVYRLNLVWYSGPKLHLKLRFQQGFMDFQYSSFRFSTLFTF